MIHAATIALRPITTMSARCAREVIAFDAATFRGEHSRSRAPHGPSHPNLAARRARRLRRGGPRQNCREKVAITMFNVSGRGLALIAVIAIALLILSIATSLGLFGWAVAIALGVYVVAMMVRGRRQ